MGEFMDISIQLKRKVIFIIMFILYATSIPVIISIIMKGEYRTFNLIVIIITELLSPFYIAIYIVNCIEEIILTYQYKYEKLYLDDLGKVFSKIGFIALVIIVGIKNFVLFYLVDVYLGTYFCFMPLLLTLDLNSIYMNEDELYLRNKNVRIPFKNIIHIRKENSQSAKLIAIEGEYDIAINEPNLKRLQSKIVIHMEDD